MYTTNLELFKTQQRELHRQANEFRLTRTLLQSCRNGSKRNLPLSRLLAQPVISFKIRNNSTD